MESTETPEKRVDVVVPRPASTVLLLREGPVCPEIFLLERHRRNAFMGGALVFPGGKVDEADKDPELLSRAAPFEQGRMANLPGTLFSSADAQGAFVAAARELFEEAGVLVARRTGETKVLTLDGPLAARLEMRRHGLHEGKMTFLEILEEESLMLALDHLAYFAHWITPSGESRRFDTRFFALRMPAGQRAKSDECETVRGVWMTARAAREGHERKELVLPPPTLRVIEEVEDHGSVGAFFEAIRGRPVHPILPKVEVLKNRATIYLPWHERYEGLDGEGISIPEDAHDRRRSGAIQLEKMDEVGPPDEALEVLRFWFGPDLERRWADPKTSARWFKRDEAHDEEIRARFGRLQSEAASGSLRAWRADPLGSLALIILLDQMSRNLFRGLARAFDADRDALQIAEEAIVRGFDQRVSPMLRAFFYMPLMHAEDEVRQRACKLAFERLNEETGLGERSLESCRRHLAIVERFGRFPHRNEALGRTSTDAERSWLAAWDGKL